MPFERRCVISSPDDDALSSLPQPNVLLTVNFPREKLDARLAAGETVSAYRKKLMDDVRRIVTHGRGQWLAMWVLETKNHPHFHVLLHLSEPKKRTARIIAKWARTKLAFRPEGDRSAPQTLWDPSNGQPVQLTAISDKIRHEASGKTGFEGLTEYLAKEIEQNHARTKGRDLGKLVGASEAIIPLVDMYGYRLDADYRRLRHQRKFMHTSKAGRCRETSQG